MVVASSKGGNTWEDGGPRQLASCTFAGVPLGCAFAGLSKTEGILNLNQNPDWTPLQHGKPEKSDIRGQMGGFHVSGEVGMTEQNHPTGGFL